MKRNYANLYVLSIVALALGVNISGYATVYGPGPHPEKPEIFVTCAIVTTLVLILVIGHFKLYNIRITPKRLKLGWNCFKSYFSSSALKEQGNLISSISYACVASHYFFLKSYKE